MIRLFSAGRAFFDFFVDLMPIDHLRNDDDFLTNKAFARDFKWMSLRTLLIITRNNGLNDWKGLAQCFFACGFAFLRFLYLSCGCALVALIPSVLWDEENTGILIREGALFTE